MAEQQPQALEARARLQEAEAKYEAARAAAAQAPESDRPVGFAYADCNHVPGTAPEAYTQEREAYEALVAARARYAEAQANPECMHGPRA